MQQARRKTSVLRIVSRLLLLFIVPVIIIGTVAAVAGKNYYDLYDWYKLRDYTPSVEVTKLADDSYMTDSARKVFYVHDPKINDKVEFNQNCPFAERTFVLGCYTGANIYLLDVKEERLASVETVTAAHEMLHATYSRLPIKERENVDRLLSEAFARQTDKRLIDLVAEYRKHDPGSVPNELHSILGTEVASLSPELEEYYDQYFTNRKELVAQYKGYEDVFAGLEKRIEVLQAEINSSSARIKQLEVDIKSTREKISAVNSRLDQFDASGDVSSYNALVPEQNRLVNDHNTEFRSYEALINTHNNNVKKINEIVIQKNSLVNSIDSKFEAI
ncbi:hypothetical protein KBB17_01435 [Candidatus Saccharibacteria bacterium]|jgi:hypothetical protein|nr:hypothetical protein [Candidatus Saccharibacteria bacterium]MBP9132266.1 hypothetical protein [Candidatus Saccharibacteria bacterium]